MAGVAPPQDVITIKCVCGEEVTFNAHRLGKILSCPHCRRYLRPALQFLLVDRSVAPNLTVQCTYCGRFIVEEPDKVGKRVRCSGCKRHLIMPKPVVKFDTEGYVRVSRKVLENQLRKVRSQWAPPEAGMRKLESAAHAGRISLRPGEHICANEACGALLPAGANVCAKCGTNRLTGDHYIGPGPEGDPVGKWREV